MRTDLQANLMRNTTYQIKHLNILTIKKGNAIYATMRPTVASGESCPTIMTNVNNMSVCTILSVSHFPIPGVVEIYD